MSNLPTNLEITNAIDKHSLPTPTDAGGLEWFAKHVELTVDEAYRIANSGKVAETAMKVKAVANAVRESSADVITTCAKADISTSTYYNYVSILYPSPTEPKKVDEKIQHLPLDTEYQCPTEVSIGHGVGDKTPTDWILHIKTTPDARRWERFFDDGVTVIIMLHGEVRAWNKQGKPVNVDAQAYAVRLIYGRVISIISDYAERNLLANLLRDFSRRAWDWLPRNAARIGAYFTASFVASIGISCGVMAVDNRYVDTVYNAGLQAAIMIASAAIWFISTIIMCAAFAVLFQSNYHSKSQ